MKRKGLLALGMAMAVVLAGGFWIAGDAVVAAGAAASEAAQTKEDIAAVLAAYTKAFEAKDIDDVMACFADSDQAVVMGTGTGEIWIGKESIRSAHMAFMASAEKERSTSTLCGSGVEGGTAWLAGYLELVQTLETGQFTTQLNLSMVLTRQEGEWRIICMHFSNLLGPETQ
jgi:uncharacterized protein (TIGR02246 family)